MCKDSKIFSCWSTNWLICQLVQDMHSDKCYNICISFQIERCKQYFKLMLDFTRFVLLHTYTVVDAFPWGKFRKGFSFSSCTCFTRSSSFPFTTNCRKHQSHDFLKRLFSKVSTMKILDSLKVHVFFISNAFFQLSHSVA